MMELRGEITPELVKELVSLRSCKDKTIWSKKQLLYLFNLTCQNVNLLHYQFFEGRSLHQECKNAAMELLLQETKKGENAAYNVVGLFLRHALQHQGCHVSLQTFWKMMDSEPEFITVIRKEYFDAIVEIIDTIWKQLEESNTLTIIQKARNSGTRKDVVSKMINSMTSMPKPTRRQERQRTETSGKVPPLIVPTINTITSSRFDLTQPTGTALQEMERLAVSLGEAIVGVQLGTLLNNRRFQQVNLFEESQQYRRSLQENSMERDPLPTPRDLAMTEAESQRNTVQSTASPQDLKKVLVILCNLIFKVLLKDLENGQYNTKGAWLPKIFDIVFSGVFSTFNRQKSQLIEKSLLPKEKIFSQLFNLSALYSQEVHLNLLFIKNVQQPEQSYDSESIEITDQLLKTMKIEKKRFNKKIMVKLGLSTLNTQEITNLKENLNVFLGIWRTNFLVVLDSYSITDPTLFVLETQLLNILGNYLKHTQSKISTYEVIERVFDLLILVKRQLLELSLPFLEQRIASPSMSQSNFNFNKKQEKSDYLPPLIYSHPELLGAFLSVISNMQVSNRFVERLINSSFVRCEQFSELLRQYGKHVLKTEYYDLVLKLLNFYRHLLEIFYERKLRFDDSKPIRTLFRSIAYLLLPKGGLITTYLQANDNVIVNLLRNKHTLNKEESRAVVFFGQLLKFCKDAFKYPVQVNPLLEEDALTAFYLRFGFLGFVRLYSFLTERQLKALREQQLNSPSPNSNTHFNHLLLKSYLELVRSLCSTRTQQMVKKILHYRILEFFVRELQLEFELNHYPGGRNRRKKILSLPQKLASQKLEKSEGPKKSLVIPILNLPNQQGFDKKSDNIQDMPTKKGVPKLNILDLKRKESPHGSYKQDQGELGSIISQINKYEISKPSIKVPNLSFKLARSDNEHRSQYLNTDPSSGSDQSLMYVHERRMRKLYSSKSLNSEIVLLVLGLLLKKGFLDTIYCPSQTVNQDKINVLSILHFHLNHPSNKAILPLLAEGVKDIQPYPSGERLLKLLSTSFTNMNVYGEKHKLSQGGSGCTIMTCATKLEEPKEVVIKQITLSNDLYRSKLTNIFSEITCLDSFRLEPRVTDLYDYGVTESSYVIIMKKYKTSLRNWRREQLQSNNFCNLALLLSIFKQVCLIIKLLHDHGVTHYDIKCDNVLLDYSSEEDLQEGRFSVVLADFGCCKMYDNEKEEFDLMYRGTEVAMSPEMLTVTSKNKKEADDFDRRKSVGTTKASDIWSLGCLFYQLLTGEYLFRGDIFGRVNKSDGEILLQKDLEELHNNIYLIDFLRFMLVRDPQHRPNINSVISRFDHIYSLLAPNKMEPYFEYASPLKLNQTLQVLLQEYLAEFQKEKFTQEYKNPCRGLQKIMKDIYICDEEFLKSDMSKILKEGITHVVATQPLSRFITMVIKPGKESPISIALRLAPRFSDLIREVLMFKGTLLFVNNKTNYAISLLIFTLSIWFKCSIYETWCLINTQILEFPFTDDFLPKLSVAYQKLSRIDQYILTLPKLQCICGSVTLILRRPLPDISKNDTLICKCKKKKSECPSARCHAYLDFLKKRFTIVWEHLIWRKVPQNHFLVGPFKCGQIKDSLRAQILMNSADSNQNLVEVSSSDPKEWRLYRCKVCEMWMLAKHREGDIHVITNTLIKSLKQGILIPNAQQNYKAKAPLLNQYTLSKLHMISS